jgi:probable rRNA maturation factor
MIDVEARSALDVDVAPLVDLIVRVCGHLGLRRASIGLMIVGPDEMATINGEHRSKPEATDVLAFPIDGPDALGDWPAVGPEPELGDIVICPDAAQDPLGTLAVHGLLHLLGYDHETDSGEMLALQDEILATVTA